MNGLTRMVVAHCRPALQITQEIRSREAIVLRLEHELAVEDLAQAQRQLAALNARVKGLEREIAQRRGK